MLKFTQSNPTETNQAVTYSTHYMKHQIIVSHKEKAFTFQGKQKSKRGKCQNSSIYLKYAINFALQCMHID